MAEILCFFFDITSRNFSLKGTCCIDVLCDSIASVLAFIKLGNPESLAKQAAFNFMSCGAVAMAKMYAGSDAALTMGLIMGAHLVSMAMCFCP